MGRQQSFQNYFISVLQRDLLHLLILNFNGLRLLQPIQPVILSGPPFFEWTIFFLLWVNKSIWFSYIIVCVSELKRRKGKVNSNSSLELPKKLGFPKSQSNSRIVQLYPRTTLTMLLLSQFFFLLFSSLLLPLLLFLERAWDLAPRGLAPSPPSLTAS